VREVAARVLTEDFGVEHDARPEPSAFPEHPWATDELPDWTHNPLVEVVTSRGSMLFELFPAEAPVHVWNFLQLARRGEYDGTIFHRVVPDFVIQGGDYRGDGNGGRTWEGQSLRGEFGPRKYVRGSLGMPRNADLDSGGSQIFVTHRPTPHLDGRYTIFGELRGGGSVLDQIELGDRILGVKLVR
jgi:cyclophilin family peptidyl-prolyl cis-trans isomerase